MAKTPPKSGQPTGRPKSRRRRVLRIAAIALAVLGLLVIAAPTILTTRPVLGIAEGMAAKRLGVPVKITGLHFGWVTPFRLEALTVAANGDEEQHPLLHVEEVEAPLTLLQVLRGAPYDLKGVRVSHLEATAIRDAHGAWNFQPVLDALETEEEQAPSEPSTGPVVLPVSQLGARVDGINIRLIDEVEKMEAGWVGGRLDLMWQGGPQPLTVDALGSIAVGQATQPFKIRAKLQHFADADNVLTPQTSILTATSGGMMHEGQIGEGGFYIHAGPGLTDEESIARVVLPLGGIADLLRESELPGAGLVPRSEGQLIARVAAMPEADGTRWNMEGALTAVGVWAEFEGYEDLPAIDSTWNVDGVFESQENAFENLAVSGRVFGFETMVRAERLLLDDFSRPRGLSIEATLDLAEASRTLAVTAGGDPQGPTPLEGSLAFSAHATTLEADQVAAEWQFTLRPGMLTTIEPFAPWPVEQLGDAPRDLTPLAFALEGTARAHWTEQQYEWEFHRVESSLASEVSGNGTYNGSTGDGNARMRKVVELEALQAAFGDVLARVAGIDELDGTVVFESNTEISESVSVISQGELRLQDLRLAMPQAGLDLDGEQMGLTWQAETHLPTAAARLNHVALESELVAMTLSGLISPQELNLTIDGNLDFDALTDRGLIPDGIALAGTADAAMGIRGNPEESVEIDLSLDMDESFAFAQQGVVQVYDRGAVRATTTIPLTDGPARFTNLDITELSIGDTMLGTLSVEWSESNELTGTMSLEGSLDTALSIMAPELFVAMGMDLLADGDGLVRSSFNGRLTHDEALGWQPEGDWTFDSDVAMDIAYVEWLADWGSGLVEEGTISHQIQMSLPMDGTGTFSLTDSGTITAGMMDGVAGLTLENTSLDSTFVMSGGATSLKVDRLSTDGGSYAAEGMRVAVPPVAASVETELGAEGKASSLILRIEEGSEVLDGNVTATYRADSERWEADGKLSVPSLAALLGLLEFDPPMDLPPVTGGALVTFDLWGGIPSEAAIASGHYPVGGTMEWDIAIDELDGGLDYQVGGLISGGRVEFEEEEGRVTASGRAVMREFANLSLRAKPLRDIEAEFTADMDGFASIAWELLDFRIGNYGTTARANGNFFDLDRALRDTTHPGLGHWLQNIAMDGRLRAEQDLTGFTGFMPMLATAGVMDLSFDYRSAPDAALFANGLLDMRDVEVHWADMFHLEGANGSWEFAKTLLLSPAARRPPPPPAGVFTVDRVAFGLPPFMAEMREIRTTLRGLEAPVTLEMTSRNFVGGTASGNAVLRMAGGDPTMEARLQATGLDVARIAQPDESTGTVRREWEVSAVSLATWRLRDVPGERSLEDLGVSLQSTRIGTRAFSRLLQAMDPDETDPSIQQSRSALRLGTPTAARADMRSGLISLDADLRLAAGLQTIQLPILNRQPIGDLLEVYQLQETMAVMPLVRWGILLLLAEDLETFERTLIQGGGTQ